MNDIKIEWELGEQMEVLKGDWAVYAVDGVDSQGNKYIGSVQTFISDPEIEDVYDIEEDNF